MNINYVSKYNTANTKYTGPYAIVTYEGSRNHEKQMNTQPGEKAHILFANGNTYHGEMKNDMLHGFGTLTDVENSSVFNGEFVEDQRQGYAVFTCPHCTYEGVYVNNKRHGKGKETDSLGNVYEGQYVDGDFVQGKISYSNGEVYVGYCKNDEPSGLGKMLTLNGDLLEGEWKDGQLL